MIDFTTAMSIEKSKYMFLKKNGKAYHQLGEITRDYYDVELIYVDSEDDEYWVGHFCEGFGFVNVRFQKSACREVTEEEITLCKNGKMREIKY